MLAAPAAPTAAPNSSPNVLVLKPNVPAAVVKPAQTDVKKKEKVTLQYIEQTLTQPVEADGTDFGMEGVTRYKSGGMLFNNKEDMAAQKGVAKDLLTSFGQNLLQGRSLIAITLPVRIFEPRSFLQRLPDAWAFAPVYLNKAALTADPVERFKLCITFFMAGLHRATTQRKPFNPILGETFQATFSDGTEIFLEQTSHHPPISAFQVFGPDGLWTLHGQHEFKASFRPTSITGGQYGPNHIEFPASSPAGATRITYELPSCELSGILMGDRVMVWTGTTTFTDTAHGLEAKITFNPDKLGTLTSFFSTAKSVSDTIRGEITQTKPAAAATAGSPAAKGAKPGDNKTVLSKIDGSWMDGINFDGKAYWTKQTVRPFPAIPVDRAVALPSDCLFREDLQALANKDLELAQQLKTLGEERQRADRELRKQAAKQQQKLEKEQAKAAAKAAKAAAK